MELATRSFDRRSFQSAQALNNLGTTFIRLDRPADARPAIEEAASISKGLSSLDGTHLAGVEMLLGELDGVAGDVTGELTHYNRGLAILRAHVVPPDHPLLASVMGSISSASGRLGRGGAAAAAESASRAVARRSQTRCAGPDCTLGARPDGAPLDQCTGCLRTYYCGRACQAADWKGGHRAECKALRTEGEGGATGGK